MGRFSLLYQYSQVIGGTGVSFYHRPFFLAVNFMGSSETNPNGPGEAHLVVVYDLDHGRLLENAVSGAADPRHVRPTGSLRNMQRADDH